MVCQCLTSPGRLCCSLDKSWGRFEPLSGCLGIPWADCQAPVCSTGLGGQMLFLVFSVTWQDPSVFSINRKRGKNPKPTTLQLQEKKLKFKIYLPFSQQIKICLPAAKLKFFKEQIVINYTFLLRTVVRLITSNYGFCRFALKLWYSDLKKSVFLIV